MWGVTISLSLARQAASCPVIAVSSSPSSWRSRRRELSVDGRRRVFPTVAAAAAIEVRDLSFSATGRNGRVVPILRDCSLRVPAGQLWMLLGPNGCGKSTLLKVLAGLLNPTSGTVCIEGPTSFVFQNPDHQLLVTHVLHHSISSSTWSS